MARNTSTSTAIGIALMVIGGGLAYWGYQQAASFGAQITQSVTGSQSDKVMTLYIGGAASFMVGLYLFFRR
jgi:hypothetical protein